MSGGKGTFGGPKLQAPPGGAAAKPVAPDGKGSVQEQLSQGQRPSLVGGDPTSRMMGQYGKGHSFAPGGAGAPTGSPASPGAAPPSPYNPYAPGLSK